MSIYIQFDNSWKKIAVSLSGGADSALLTYLVCDYILKNKLNVELHTISHIRCWKTKPWQQYDSIRVFEFLKLKFPTIEFFRHENFIAPELEYDNIGASLVDEYNKKVSGDNIQQRAFAEYLCTKLDIDAYFNGVTKNPEPLQSEGMDSRNISKSAENCYLEYMTHMEKVVAHPFRFIDKSEIYRAYKEHNILDLFEITRSCEGTFSNITYKSYTPYQEVPECGECFWCKERKWAIEQD